MYAKVYFDDIFKCWGIIYFDENGSPFGDADWHHLKSSAVKQARRELSEGKIEHLQILKKDMA